MKIMIIDDDSIIINSYKQILKKFGYKEVEFVKNGINAIEKIKKFKPDIIWLDIRMPGINGLNILRKLKNNANTKNIYVVAHSIYAMPDDIQKCLDLGANSFLAKPMGIDKFIGEIQKVQNLKSKERR